MVVVVIAIMASLAALAVGGNEQREFRRDLGRLQLLLELARDEAFIKGIELGWLLDENGENYAFYYFDSKDGEWRSYGHNALSARKLAAEYRFTMKQSGQQMDLAKLHQEKRALSDHYQSIIGKTEEEQKQSVLPQIIFFSDGTYTPFDLTITHTQHQTLNAVLVGDGVSAVINSEEATR